MNLRRFYILPLLFFALTACGKKGPVRPLLQPLPAAPGHLTVEQQGERFAVAWTIPTAYQDGTPLADLQGFQVFKMQFDATRDCPECRDTSVLLANVDLDYLRAVQRNDQRLTLWDADLVPGSSYQYRVVPFTRTGAAGLPATAKRPCLVPPPPPTGLTASGHDRMVKLEWAAPANLPQAVELKGYNLYRRLPGEVFPDLPLNHEPLAAPAYEDFSVTNDIAYGYAVRSVADIGGIRVESVLSAAVNILPRAGQ